MIEPPAGEVFAWGEFPPTMRLAGGLREGGRFRIDSRLYLTANILQGSRIVDRVALFDDGTHDDSAAGDGSYTATYVPPTVGEYSVRVRAQWNDGGRTREAFADLGPYWVEKVPYIHLTSPEPGGRVGEATKVRGRLLLDGKPFTEGDPSLRGAVQTAGGGSGELRRRGSLVTGDLRFAGKGPQTYRAELSLERRGKTLTTRTSDIPVDVSAPPTLLCVLAGGCLIAYLLVPPRRVNRFSFTLAVSRGGNTGSSELSLLGERDQDTVLTLGGNDGQLSGMISEPLVDLVAAPGVSSLNVKSRGGSEWSGEATLKRSGDSGKIGGWTVTLDSVRAKAPYVSPRWVPSTRLRLTLLLLAVGLFAGGWWQYQEFFRQ